MNAVHVVLPEGVDDPRRPSGGNRYDRRVCHGLADLGWMVREHQVPGNWPRPDSAARQAVAGALAQVPDGCVVLLDGLVASTVPQVLAAEQSRLPLVVLVHLPLGAWVAGRARDAASQERLALSAASAVVTTSAWTRTWLLDTYGLAADRVHVVEPGADRVEPTPATDAGGGLLCVGAVTAAKGYDVLLAALAAVDDLAWQCVCVGSRDRDPAFADRVRVQADEAGIGQRVRFTGAVVGRDLDRAYAGADLLVLASRAETYGMVVTEALARAIPVLATDVGGVSEALGRSPGGGRPGLLVPPDDPVALAAALRCWLGDADLRLRLRAAARARRETLMGWPVTSQGIAAVLAEVLGVAA